MVTARRERRLSCLDLTQWLSECRLKRHFRRLPVATAAQDDHRNTHTTDQCSTPLLAIHYTMRKSTNRVSRDKKASRHKLRSGRHAPSVG